MSTINQSSPTEIIGKIMSGDTMEPVHPLLEPTVIGVHFERDTPCRPLECPQPD